MPVIASFFFGLIFGSFVNVLALRYNSGVSLGGRSGCMTCGKKLEWYELIPVLSFIFQRGRCRSCGTHISFQYPFIELFTGFLFGAITYVGFANYTGGLPYIFILFGWIATVLLIPIALYDMRHMIIPDGLVYAYGGLSLAWSIGKTLILGEHLVLMTFIAGPLVALPFAFLWFVSRGKWMGFGDAKLACGMGWMLGLTGGISALVFAVWIGAIVSLALIVGVRILPFLFRLVSSKNRFTIKSEIPFGPFLVVSTLFVFLTNVTIVEFISHLSL